MHKFISVAILALVAHCACSLAATPTFQIAPRPVWFPQFLESHNDVMTNAAENAEDAILTDANVLVVTAIPDVLRSPEKSADFSAKGEATISDQTENFRTVNFLRNPENEYVLKNIFTNEALWSRSLYVFLKDLKMRSEQKSKNWLVPLIVLCCVLYWGRRRSTRIFLRLHSEFQAGQNHSM